jgi:hypothetical protein
MKNPTEESLTLLLENEGSDTISESFFFTFKQSNQIGLI